MSGDRTYIIEYSKSNRAGCKTCKAKIDKGVLRVGDEHEGMGDFMVTDWRHLECQKRPKNVVTISEFRGLDQLNPDDRKTFEAWFEAGGAAAKKSASAVAGADGKAPAADLIGLNVDKLKAADRKKMLESYGLSTEGKKSDLVKRLQEVVRTVECEAKFNSAGIPALKENLRENNQKVGGNKPELVARCVDGAMYGSLPRCPDCGAGRLQVRYPAGVTFGHGGQGTFYCPGYFDDDTFRRCSFSSTSVERSEWLDAQGLLAGATQAKSTIAKSTAAATSKPKAAPKRKAKAVGGAATGGCSGSDKDDDGLDETNNGAQPPTKKSKPTKKGKSAKKAADSVTPATGDTWRVAMPGDDD